MTNKTTMKVDINSVEKLANDLLNKNYEFITIDGTKHSVSPSKDLGYTFKFDNSKRRFGCCNYVRQTISLSKPLCELNLDKIKTRITDCILHEIAHALCVYAYGRSLGRGHGTNWKLILLAIGGDGKRTYDGSKVNKVQSKYTLSCETEGCTFEIQRHRKPKYDSSCPKCCSTWNPKYKLKINQNF